MKYAKTKVIATFLTLPKRNWCLRKTQCKQVGIFSPAYFLWAKFKYVAITFYFEYFVSASPHCEILENIIVLFIESLYHLATRQFSSHQTHLLTIPPTVTYRKLACLCINHCFAIQYDFLTVRRVGSLKQNMKNQTHRSIHFYLCTNGISA